MHPRVLIRSKIKLNQNVSTDPILTTFDHIWPNLTQFDPNSTSIWPKWGEISGYGWITKELSNISDGKMVVCFGDHTKPDGFVDDYSIKSTLNSIKSLIYRLDTPYMSNKAKSSQQLYDAIRPVIETQGKLCVGWIPRKFKIFIFKPCHFWGKITKIATLGIAIFMLKFNFSKILDMSTTLRWNNGQTDATKFWGKLRLNDIGRFWLPLEWPQMTSSDQK